MKSLLNPRRWIARSAPLAVCACWLTLAPIAAAQTPPPVPPQTAPGILPEPKWLNDSIKVVLDKFTSSGAPREGFYPTFGTRMPGSGWIAAGPGFRHHLSNDRLFADVSGAISWRKFMGADARLEVQQLANGHVTLGTQLLAQDWTQIMFYGVGPDADRSRRSQYRLRAADASVYAMVNPGRRVDMRMRFGSLSAPRIDSASGWHMRDFPDTLSEFTAAEAPGLGGGPRLWHADVAITADSLDHPGHPVRGGVVQIAASAFHDSDTGTYSFRRMEVIALRMFPLIGHKWRLAARGTIVASSPSKGNQVPFFLMPTLGGQSLLRGYDSDRFRDRNLAAINFESRWALFEHLDAALFTDMGGVAPTINAFKPSRLEAAVGAGLRIHTGVATLVRIDIARGSEGWRLAFKLSDSLSLSTIRRWATVVPIVP